MVNILASRGGVDGAPIAKLYVGDKSSATLQRGLQWIVNVFRAEGVELHPEVTLADDDKAERKAIQLTWPRTQVQYVLSISQASA